MEDEVVGGGVMFDVARLDSRAPSKTRVKNSALWSKIATPRPQELWHQGWSA
mgnify:CR=1 FL=1